MAQSLRIHMPYSVKEDTGIKFGVIPRSILLKLQNATSQIIFNFNNNNLIYAGSGFYYYDTIEDLFNGYFITAAHCVMATNETNDEIIDKITEAYIQNPISTKWFSVNINAIYIDGIADIALIKTGINLTNYPEYCLKLNTEPVNSGDICYVVGNPTGIDEDSISSGCVRDPHYCDPGGNQITDSILVTAPGIGGNSGGPIVNINGDVIGIFTFGRRENSYSIFECYGGGSNQSVLFNTLKVLKNGIDNKSKLYLGLDWSIQKPFRLKGYYPNQNTFDTNGVLIFRVNSESPFFNILLPNDLLLKCELIEGFDTRTIIFGNNNNQKTPGVLLYYPINTVIKIYWIKDTDKILYNTQILLNKIYDNVPTYLDYFLLGGYRDESYKNITTLIKPILH